MLHINRRMVNLMKIFSLGVVFCGVILIYSQSISTADAESDVCDQLGWFPTEFGLKDHHVFIFDGYYYLISNYIPGEKFFAYARSTDLCDWENLTPVLEQRKSEWESSAVWAPYVYEEGGTYYLYYTGVKGPIPYLTQSIMLATSTNPADPDAWEQQGMIFQPDHENMIWEDNQWADCRDPMVMKIDDTYYLYYSGRDVDGGIIGLATSDAPDGSWTDWGSILTILEDPIPESPTVFVHDTVFYLFYNHQGEDYRIGASPGGPWSNETRFTPGWAHEFWFGMESQTYTSYLTNLNVTISPLGWDSLFVPPRPYIGTEIYLFMIPILKR
jgi:hypothetical protein